ncbi:TetR/AcrR family transcriptional regulator [uncultured Sutterella sp.]|uniref:TetR/AcrR family transcriptional regulator n=1 Tax=uncultured Sutterella sp. TaxID=286133 RepID=UPI0026381583|nr:TetR/AcrR family transcriptional regulator [uncultured Sutterella sp.]
MEAHESRESHQGDSREAILNAAETRFAAAGIDGVSMREIAEDVGITKAALYYHFPGKDALWLAVCERLARIHITGLTEAVAGIPDPREKLKRFVSFLVDRFFENPNLSLLIQRSILDPDEERSRKCSDIAYRETFRILYDLAGKLGITEDRQHWALLVAGMCLMPFEARKTLEWLPGAEEGNFTPDRIKRSILRILFPEGFSCTPPGESQTNCRSSKTSEPGESR